MAGIVRTGQAPHGPVPGRVAGVGTQVGLIFELRWRLLCNALRTWRGRAEFFAFLLMVVLGGLSAVGIGIALGVGAFFGIAKDRPSFFVGALWAVFLCWLVAPVMLAGFAVEFEFRRLLQFPLRFSAFVLLSLAYGLADPPSLVALLWTACIAAGIAFARPELLTTALLVLGVFTAVNLLGNRLVISWVERLLSRKRTREAVVAVFVLAILGVQLFGALAERWEDKVEPVLERVAPVARILPPAVVGDAINSAAKGNRTALWLDSGLLAAYGLACAWLLGRRLRAQYAGEVEETAGGTPALRTKGAVTEGWYLPGLSGSVAAVCEKELRYTMRNGQTLLSLVIPLVIVLFFAIVWGNPKTIPEPLRRAPELFFPLAVGYAFLVLAPLMHNTFGFDGKGIQLLFLAPVRFQDVLLGKNLVHSLLILLETGLVWLLVSAFVTPPPAGITLFTLSAVLLVTFVHLIVGNWLSLLFPRQIEFGHFRKRTSQLNVLLGLITQVAVMGVVAGVYAQSISIARSLGDQTRAVGAEWANALAGTICFGLSAGAFFAYRASLNYIARTAFERQENLTAELCR